MRSEAKSRRSFSEGGKKMMMAMFLIFIFVGCAKEEKFTVRPTITLAAEGIVSVQADNIDTKEVKIGSKGDVLLKGFECDLRVSGATGQHHEEQLALRKARLGENVDVYYKSDGFAEILKINAGESGQVSSFVSGRKVEMIKIKKVCFDYSENGSNNSTEWCLKPLHQDACRYFF